MLYAHKFFKTKEDAKAFQKKHGGALYSNAPGSRTKRDYLTEAAMAVEKDVTKAVRELGYNPDKQSLTIEALSSGRCSVSFGKYWIGIWDTLRKTFVD